MPSAPNARFPAAAARVLLSLALVAALAACSPDEEATDVQGAGGSSPSPRAGSTGPATPGGSDGGTSGNGGASGGSIRVAAKDRKRTVRGRAPGYVQIESASLDPAVDRLQMTVELTGKIPRKMPNQNSVLRVTFMITTKDGVRYTFEAQCLRTGWGAFASGGKTPEYIPELALSERGLTLTIDPLYIGGLRPFDWLASVAWTEGDVNYAFDVVPAEGFASYP